MVAKVLILAATLAVAMALPSPGENVEIIEAQPLSVAGSQAVPVAYEQVAVPVATSRSGDLLSLGSGWTAAPQKPLISVGWAPAQPAHGWAPAQESSGWGWAPKVKYLKFSIPIPVLPRIKFGVKGGLRLHASVQQPKGWGWSR